MKKREEILNASASFKDTLPRPFNYDADEADVQASANVPPSPSKQSLTKSSFSSLFDPTGATVTVLLGGGVAAAGALAIAAASAVPSALLIASAGALTASGIGLVIFGVLAIGVGLSYLFSSGNGIDELKVDTLVMSGAVKSARPLASVEQYQSMENPYSMYRALNMEAYRGIEAYDFILDSDDVDVEDKAELSRLDVPQIPGSPRLAEETIALFDPLKIAEWTFTNTNNKIKFTKKPSKNKAYVDRVPVKVFSMMEYGEVADALGHYFLEATHSDSPSALVGSFDMSGRYIPYFKSLTQNQGVSSGIALQTNSHDVARKEFYALRYIALLGSTFEWLLSEDNPKAAAIKEFVFNGVPDGGTITSFDIMNRMMELLKEEYAPKNGVPKFSSAAHYIMNSEWIREKTSLLHEIIGVYTSSLEGSEVDQGVIEATKENAFIRFNNLTLGETTEFMRMFSEYARIEGYTVAADASRAQRLRACRTDSKLITDILNKNLAGAPIKDYLESLGYTPDQIVDTLCNALTDGGKRPASLQSPSFLLLSQQADLFDQSRIHATISLMTAGAVEPAEWVRRLGASGALVISTLPIANKEAFVAQIARTAAESGITDVKGMLEEYLPPEATADIDVDTVIENVGADVTLEQTAIDKAEFEASQDATALSGISTGAKIGIALGIGALAAGGYWWYKNKRGSGTPSASSEDDNTFAVQSPEDNRLLLETAADPDDVFTEDDEEA